MSYVRDLLKLCVLLPLVGCAVSHATGGEGEAPASLAQSALDGAATLTFGADWTASASGPVHAGAPVTVAYDARRLPTCRGTLGGRRQWAITAFWQLDGGAVGALDVSDAPATLTAAHPGDLALWFQVTDRWGCMAYDSAFGANYHFAVQPRADAPGWLGNAVSVVSRATCGAGPCDADRRPLDAGVTYDSWSRTRAAIRELYFDVWKEGVTDRDDPDLWKKLDVQVHTRFVAPGTSAAPAGATAWASGYVAFDHRVDHDARYDVPLRPLDPFHGSGIATAAGCPPVPLVRSVDGLAVETTMELYFTVNGVELRPAAGGPYRVKFSDYAGLYAVCAVR